MSGVIFVNKMKPNIYEYLVYNIYIFSNETYDRDHLIVVIISLLPNFKSVKVLKIQTPLSKLS